VRRARSTRAAAVALAVLALAACGKRGNPVPPETRVPHTITDLTATARETGIDVVWSVPRRRADGSRLIDPGVTRLFRTDDAGTGDPRAALRVKDRVAGYTEIASFRLQDPPVAELQGGRINYMDRRDLVFGRRYTYVALTTDMQGRTSAPSPRVSVTYIAPPEPPEGLRAQAGDGQAQLSWQPPARLADGTPVSGTLRYEVLRAPDETSPPAVVGRTATDETTFVDRGLANDQTYHYAVRAIRNEGQASSAGAATARVAVTPVKTTAPAAPTNLAAIASRGEVRLSWTPSTAPDVATYVIYRATRGGQYVRIGSVRPPATTFVDRAVPPGQYRYAVTAQDASLRANESVRSNEVDVTVP